LGAIAQISREKLQQLVTQIDEEWIVLFLRQYLVVYDSPDDVPDDLEEGAEMRSSPDLQNAIVVRDAQDKGALAYLMLECFFAQEVVQGRRLMEATRAELDPELEEESLRFRNGRLADLGFLSREEAIELYAPKDGDKIISEAQKRSTSPTTIDLDLLQHTGLPAPYLEPMEASGILAEVLSLPGSEDIARRFMLELPALLNRVLSANSANPSDRERIEQLTKHTRALLDIAARLTSKEDLRKLSLQETFRIGWWQIAKLQPRAKKVAASFVFSLLEGTYRSAVRALAEPIPRYSLSLSKPPGEGVREFLREDELKSARAALEHAEASHALLQRMNITERDIISIKAKQLGAAEINMSTLFGTSLSNALLGRPFAPEPLRAQDLKGLKEKLFAQGEIAPAVALSAQETMKSLPPELQDAARSAVSFWLASLVEELSRLDTTQQIEPRFIGGVLLQA
jgi:hypothetical protein